MLVLKVSLIVALVLTNIVTFVTFIWNISWISSLFSLWLFNRGLILKVITIEEISIWSCDLWFADFLALTRLLNFFMTRDFLF